MKSMKKGMMGKGKPNPFAKIKPLPVSTKKKPSAVADGPIGFKDLSSMKESLK